MHHPCCTSYKQLGFLVLHGHVCHLQVAHSVYGKAEWVRFPFSLLMKPLGAIAIDRRPRGPENERPGFIDAMAGLFNANDELIILITPEGTRSRNDKWKTGFYHVATAAEVPVLLGHIDYEKKLTGISKSIFLSDYQHDMNQIMTFYSGIAPKFPQNFVTDSSFPIEPKV